MWNAACAIFHRTRTHCVHGACCACGAAKSARGNVAGGNPATTDVVRIAYRDGVSASQCKLHSGRTHQIRVHMAAIHHPLVGDQVYGKHNPKLPEFPRQALHATRLGLVHPLTGFKMQWEVPMPEDMRDLLDGLRYG